MSQLSVSKLKPMAGYILVEPHQQETKTKSGIILTDSKDEKPQYGKVLAVAEGKLAKPKTDDCCGGCDEVEAKCEVSAKCLVKVGDTVIYKKWGGNDVVIDDVEYQFLKCEDILAIVK